MKDLEFIKTVTKQKLRRFEDLRIENRSLNGRLHRLLEGDMRIIGLKEIPEIICDKFG